MGMDLASFGVKWALNPRREFDRNPWTHFSGPSIPVTLRLLFLWLMRKGAFEVTQVILRFA